MRLLDEGTLSRKLAPETWAAANAAMAEVREHLPLGVAISGGVDSATLLALAAIAAPPGEVVGIIGVSPSLAEEERDQAHRTAREIGVELAEVETHEALIPDYVRNGPDRCYFCRQELFMRISSETVQDLGLIGVAYGENVDDVDRLDRPGSRAAIEAGVLRPLATAGITKQMVREIARALDLEVANKPAAPCLASRIPHFENVTVRKLSQVEVAEEAIRLLGFRDCRVRHHGEVARVELLEEDLNRAIQHREAIVRNVLGAGFRFVTLDLSGMQRGAFTAPYVGDLQAAQ